MIMPAKVTYLEHERALRWFDCLLLALTF